MKNRLSMLMLAVFVLVGCSTMAQATTWEFTKAKVEITYPDTWTHEVNKQEVDVIGSPDGNAAAIIRVVTAKDLEKALEETIEGLAREFGELEDKEPKTEELKINGMDAMFLDEIRTVDKKTEIGIAMIVTPVGQIVTLAVIGTPEAAKKYEKDFGELIKSIKPKQ
ncbi:MAG TPA: hypothetical protein PKO06_04565 [Candidatus Ozemobacteraceae bacterium]|nr:hypothetical protein [Candidatus Ozemobacteraceae bacterium]